MSYLESASFLRRILTLDAAVSAAAGLLMASAAESLERWLGVPAALLRVAGLALLPFAAALVTLARSSALPRRAVVAVITANAAWVVASVAVLFGLRPSPLGYAFILGQAAAVVVLAEMEMVGLKRAS